MLQRSRRALALSLLLFSFLSIVPLASAAERELPAAPIDLNTATEEELTAVRGIGKVTARRIVAFREEHGPFTRVEDLLKVQGIGEKSLEKIAPQLMVTSRR